jgi:deoxyribonucleoside regulator
VVESKEVGELLMNEGSVADIMKKGMSADIALFTGGAFGHRSALYRAGYLTDSDLKTLTAKGAVGDVASHIIDIEGRICDEELDQRTMAVPLESLRNADCRICVAQGYSKVNCVLAILKGGIANVLVTDEETAEWILKRADEL